MSQELPSILLQAILAASVAISLVLEVFIHRHIVSLGLPFHWRLSIYFDVLAILSIALSVVLDGYPPYLTTVMIVASPFYVGIMGRFLNFMGM